MSKLASPQCRFRAARFTKTLFLVLWMLQVGPYNDYFMKFYEAAKYYYTGGMHEPGGVLHLA